VSAQAKPISEVVRSSSNPSKIFGPPPDGPTWRPLKRLSDPLTWNFGIALRLANYWPPANPPPKEGTNLSFLKFFGDRELEELVSDEDSASLQNWVIQTLAKETRSVKNPSIATRRDLGLIAALCAAPGRGSPRKWPENSLKIEGREVLLWDVAIEEPCFAVSLCFWHAWRERPARPDQRRLYRKSLDWSQSRLFSPDPTAPP
jgi:hypothetical protein